MTYWPSADQIGDAKINALALGDDTRLRAVSVGDPDVLGTIAIADEHDLLAVRRIARLLVPARAVRDARGGAARDRDRVEVAEYVEGDRMAIGRDVEGDP